MVRDSEGNDVPDAVFMASQPVLTTSGWPVMVRDSEGNDVPDAVFMASHQHWEEKSTDVNVASHLLLDVVGGHISNTRRHTQP